MAENGTGIGIEVGSVTAVYTVDSSQAVPVIANIKADAAMIRQQFGNVTMKLDGSQAIEQTKQMIAAATAAKVAYADAQTALANYRNAQVAVAEATATARQYQVLANQTIAETRVLQQQAAVQTAILTNAINQQRLATEQARTAHVQGTTDLNNERVATEQLRQTHIALTNQTVTLRNAMLEKNLALAEQTKQSNTASQSHNNLATSLLGGIGKALLYAAAFRLVFTAIQDVTQAFKSAIDAPVQWEQMMNELQSNTILTDQAMQSISTQILQMATQTSAPLDGLADSYRHVANEGFAASEATKIVNEAQMSAVSSGTNVAATTNILASIMHEFGAQTNQASGYMNVLHLASAEGNTTLEQFVASGGRAFATAASLGVNVTEVAAALATLSREGYNAFQSTTMVSDIIAHIIAPSAQAKAEILALSKATGVDLVNDFTQGGLAGKGISGIMADIEKATNGDAEAMFKLIPSLRGGRGELVLTTQGAGDFRQILADLNDTMAGKTNPTLDAFNRTSQTAAFQIGEAKNAVHVLFIELGQYLLPVIKVVADEVKKLATDLAVMMGLPTPKFADAFNTTTTATNGTTTASRNLEAQIHETNSAISDHTQSILDASNNLDQYKKEALDVGTAIRGLTDDHNNLKAALDGVNESIRKANDDFKSTVDPLQAQITRNDQLTPEQHARAIAQLTLQQQELQIKINAPDTTDLDKTISDLHQKIDDLGRADTASLDTQIQDLQDRMQKLGRSATFDLDQQILDVRHQMEKLGDTTGISRRIEDLKRQINAPAPDVSGQTSGLASLFEQRAAGQISEQSFQNQYGALSRQKGQILDNYQLQQSQAKTQLQILEDQEIVQKRTDEDAKKALDVRLKDLEFQKSQTDLDNAKIKADLQSQLDTLQDQRRTVIDTYNQTKNSLQDDLTRAEHEKTTRLQETRDQLARNAREQDRNKLLDDYDKVTRAILDYPIKQQIEEANIAHKATIDPLTQQRDLIQQQLDKNNENLATERERKSNLDAQIAAAKDFLKTTPFGTGGTGLPTNAPGGAPTGYTGVSGGSLGGRDVGTAETASNAIRDNPMVKWADDIRIAFENLRGWFAAHKGEIGSGIKTVLDGVGSAIHNAGDIFSEIGSIAEFLFYFSKGMLDVATLDFGAAIRDFGHMGEGAAGTIHGGMNLQKDFGGGGSGGSGGGGISGASVPGGVGSVISNPLGSEAHVASEVPNMFTTNPFEPGGFFWLLLHPGQTGANDTSTQPFIGPQPIEGPPLPPDWGDKQAAQAQAAINANNDLAQNTASIYGPDSPTTMAISNYIDRFIKGFGQDGTVGQAVETTKTTVTNDLGSGSSTQQAFASMDQAAMRVFGSTGTLKQYMGTDTPAAMGQMKTAVDQYLSPGVGTAVTPISAYETFMQRIFGSNGGSISTLMTTDVPASYRGYLQEVLDRFGDTGDAKTPFTTYGDFIKALFQKGGSMDQYVQAFGPVIDAAMPSDIAPLAGFIKSVGDAIHTIGAIFKIKEMADFPVPTISYAGSGNKNYAMGVSNSPMPGHVAWVGERGPELMHVPQGSTIIPNHMLPGHADGLNLSAIQAFTLPGAFQPLADYLYKTEQSSMSALVAAYQGSASGRGRASLRQLVPLIQKWANADSIPADIIGAIILHESGGNIGQVEIGGGKGRGLMQVDGGTWPQAYDPRMVGTSLADADYQIEIGSMVLQQGWDPNNIVQSLRNYSGSGFDAVHGRSFYQELIDMGFIAQADAALAGGSGALAGLSGGGWIEVVNAAADRVGQFFQDNGLQWFLWCEKFVNDMDQAGGFSPRRHGTAYLHAIDTDLDPNSQPPAGASVFFDQSWGEAGHTAVATGNDTETISTTSHGVDYWNIIGSPGYMGWAPPGAANGAVVSSPTLLVAGDIPGGVPEIIAPQPMMQRTVENALKNAGGSGPLTLVVEDGAVRVDHRGNIESVDQSKFKLVSAGYARSMTFGR